MDNFSFDVDNEKFKRRIHLTYNGEILISFDKRCWDNKYDNDYILHRWMIYHNVTFDTEKNIDAMTVKIIGVDEL